MRWREQRVREIEKRKIETKIETTSKRERKNKSKERQGEREIPWERNTDESFDVHHEKSVMEVTIIISSQI